MMKRWMAALLALMLLAASPLALAEINIPPEEYTQKLTSDARGDWAELISGGVRGISLEDFSREPEPMTLPEITDKVTIQADGAINVVAEDVSITVYIPFGMVALTQDARAQADTYAMMSDPITFVENLRDNGVHIYMLDLDTEAEVFVSTGQNVVSSIVSDLDELSASDLEDLIEQVADLEPNAYIYTRLCGGHKYLVYDYRQSGTDEVIYTAIKNSRNIDFTFVTTGGEMRSDDIDNMEYLLSDTLLAAA